MNLNDEGFYLAFMAVCFLIAAILVGGYVWYYS